MFQFWHLHLIKIFQGSTLNPDQIEVASSQEEEEEEEEEISEYDLLLLNLSSMPRRSMGHLKLSEVRCARLLSWGPALKKRN